MPAGISYGTGPYLYVEDGDDYYLYSYAGWWQDKPNFTRIDLINTLKQIAYKLLETGAVSMVGSDPQPPIRLLVAITRNGAFY